jgi:hypothetical protein
MIKESSQEENTINVASLGKLSGWSRNLLGLNSAEVVNREGLASSPKTATKQQCIALA